MNELRKIAYKGDFKVSDLNNLIDYINVLNNNGYLDIPVTRLLQSMGGGSDYDPSIVVKNNSSSEAIPAYAAMEVISVNTSEVHTVRKPLTDSLSSGYILFNGPSVIPADGTGTGYHCTDAPAECMILTGETSYTGYDMGTTANQWYLTRDHTGFVCIGWAGGSSNRAWMRPFRSYTDLGNVDTYPDISGDAFDTASVDKVYTFMQYGDAGDNWGQMTKNVYDPFNFRNNVFTETIRISKWDPVVGDIGGTAHRSWAGWTFDPWSTSDGTFNSDNITRAYIDVEFQWLENDRETSKGVDPTMDIPIYILLVPYNDLAFSRDWGWILDDTLLYDKGISTTNVMCNEVSSAIGERVRIYETDAGGDYTGEYAFVESIELNETFDPDGLTSSFGVGDTYTMSPVILTEEETGTVSALDDVARTIQLSGKSWDDDTHIGRQVWTNPSIPFTITDNNSNILTLADNGLLVSDHFSVSSLVTIGPEYDDTTEEVTGTVSSIKTLKLTDNSQDWTVDEHIDRRLFYGDVNSTDPYDPSSTTYWTVDDSGSDYIIVAESGSAYVRNAIYLEDFLSTTYDATGDTNARIWYCEDENLWSEHGNMIPIYKGNTNDDVSPVHVPLPLNQVKEYIDRSVGMQFIVVPQNYNQAKKVAHLAVFPGDLTVDWSVSCDCDAGCDACDGDCTCDTVCDTCDSCDAGCDACDGDCTCDTVCDTCDSCDGDGGGECPCDIEEDFSCGMDCGCDTVGDWSCEMCDTEGGCPDCGEGGEG